MCHGVWRSDDNFKKSVRFFHCVGPGIELTSPGNKGHYSLSSTYILPNSLTKSRLPVSTGPERFRHSPSQSHNNKLKHHGKHLSSAILFLTQILLSPWRRSCIRESVVCPLCTRPCWGCRGHSKKQTR